MNPVDIRQRQQPHSIFLQGGKNFRESSSHILHSYHVASTSRRPPRSTVKTTATTVAPHRKHCSPHPHPHRNRTQSAKKEASNALNASRISSSSDRDQRQNLFSRNFFHHLQVHLGLRLGTSTPRTTATSIKTTKTTKITDDPVPQRRLTTNNHHDRVRQRSARVLRYFERFPIIALQELILRR